MLSDDSDSEDVTEVKGTKDEVKVKQNVPKVDNDDICSRNFEVSSKLFLLLVGYVGCFRLYSIYDEGKGVCLFLIDLNNIKEYCLYCYTLYCILLLNKNGCVFIN